jgi:hypothetical protein
MPGEEYKLWSSSLCSFLQPPVTSSLFGPDIPFMTFHNKLILYGEELLAQCRTPKLEDYPLSAVRDYLFITFAATVEICFYLSPLFTLDVLSPCVLLDDTILCVRFYLRQ